MGSRRRGRRRWMMLRAREGASRGIGWTWTKWDRCCAISGSGDVGRCRVEMGSCSESWRRVCSPTQRALGRSSRAWDTVPSHRVDLSLAQVPPTCVIHSLDRFHAPHHAHF
mgnify:CR=1 FL=1